jgi:hypothetical protein
MSDLPGDCWNIVLEFLDDCNDFYRLMRCCKNIYYTVMNAENKEYYKRCTFWVSDRYHHKKWMTRIEYIDREYAIEHRYFRWLDKNGIPDDYWDKCFDCPADDDDFWYGIPTRTTINFIDYMLNYEKDIIGLGRVLHYFTYDLINYNVFDKRKIRYDENMVGIYLKIYTQKWVISWIRKWAIFIQYCARIQSKYYDIWSVDSKDIKDRKIKLKCELKNDKKFKYLYNQIEKMYDPKLHIMFVEWNHIPKYNRFKYMISYDDMDFDNDDDNEIILMCSCRCSNVCRYMKKVK